MSESDRPAPVGVPRTTSGTAANDVGASIEI
jgi:hypothetical protein